MQAKRRSSERRMSAFESWKRRTFLLSGLSVAAMACAAGLALADSPSPLSPSAVDLGAEISVSSPLVGGDQGGGSRCPVRLENSGAFANLLGVRNPPPLPGPTRG